MSPGAGGHTDAARFLQSYLHFTILNANGDSAARSKRLIRPVDVNGSVRVAFDARALADYRPTLMSVSGDTAGRRLVLLLLDDLAQYGRIASALTRSLSQPAPAFDSASARATQWYDTYFEHIEAFFEHQVRVQDPGATGDLSIRAGEAAQPFMGREKMGSFARYLQSELVRLLRDADQSESGALGMLSLVAWRITPQGDSVRVGLRGYDTTTAQSSSVISKITTVMSADERASLEFHRDVASKVRNVRDVFATASQNYVALAEEARGAINGLVGAARVLQDSIRNALRRPGSALTLVPDSVRPAVTRVKADLRELADSVVAVLRPIQDLQQALRSIGPGDDNPLAVLPNLSNSVNAISGLGPRIGRLGNQTRALAMHIAELADLASVADLGLPDTVVAAVTQAITAYRRVESIAKRARDLITPGRNVTGVAAAFDPEWIARLNLTPRAAATAPETEIQITKAGGDRTDGDLLVLRADLLNPDQTGAGSYEWTFRLEKLGLSSRFAAGVAFTGRLGPRADDALRPAPVLAWVLRNRTRGESGWGRAWNALDISLGMHIMTLSSETQAVQFGTGLSLNLFQDFLQFGLGRKLQPENADDRWYWYFGLGLFKLAHLGQ
jgi:hypothetical protein